MTARPGTVRIDDLADPQLPDDIVAMRESVRELAAGLSFDLATLEAQAKVETGLDDFGDDLHREPFAVCLRALDTEAGLGPLGRMSAHGNFGQFLRNRLEHSTASMFRRHSSVSRKCESRRSHTSASTNTKPLWDTTQIPTASNDR